jgi:iron complex transport system ATP-binding protein
MVNDKSSELRMRGVDLGYRGRAVVRDVDLTLRSGEVVCLLGQNGAGKTTLFRTLLGFIRPLAGTVTIDGRELSGYSAGELAALVSYVPQSHSTPFPYRVDEVVLFGRTVHLGIFSSPGKHDRFVADRSLDLLGIGHLGSRFFTELSGGERQLVMIARALAQEARFMILDEPVSNLDYGNQVRVVRKIRELGLGSTGIIMATHHPDHAFMTASSVAVLHGGTMVQGGSPDSMLTPSLLERIYGVEVQVFDVPGSGQEKRRVCAPLMDAGSEGVQFNQR